MNDDLISRKAVLEILGDIHPLDYNAQAYVSQIKELPTISQTETVKGLDETVYMQDNDKQGFTPQTNTAECVDANVKKEMEYLTAYNEGWNDCCEHYGKGDLIYRKAVLDLSKNAPYVMKADIKKLPTIPQTNSSVIAKIKKWLELPEYSEGERNVMKVILQELEDTISQTEERQEVNKSVKELTDIAFENLLNKCRETDKKILDIPQTDISLEQAIDRLHELGWLQEHDRILTEYAEKQTDSVLEDIKADLRKAISDFATDNGDTAYGLRIALEIVCQHISRKENK